MVHRPRALAEDDVVEDQALRVASPARVMLDLAGEGASRRQLERALDQAEINELHLPIDALLPRCRRRRGAAKLRAVLEWHQAGSTITESEAEEAFLAIIEARRPARTRFLNATVEGKRRDFVWPRATDRRGDRRPRASTTRPRAFERDRVRGNEATLAGWTHLRFTRRRVVRRPPRSSATSIRALRLGFRAP